MDRNVSSKWLDPSVCPTGNFFFPTTVGDFFSLQNLVTFWSQFVRGKCQKSVIRLSFFAWFFPVLVSQNQIAFVFEFWAPSSHHRVCPRTLVTLRRSDGTSHQSVCVFLFWKGSITRDRPSGGSPDPGLSGCPRGGGFAVKRKTKHYFNEFSSLN